MDSKPEHLDPKILSQHYEDGAAEERVNYVTPGMPSPATSHLVYTSQARADE